MQRLKRFILLSRQQRWLLFQALVITCAIRLTLGLLSVHRVQRLGHKIGAAKASYTADRMVWAIHKAARFIPGSTCLVQALAAQALLFRHGYRPHLTIGVEKSDHFSAHAWVACGDEIVIGGQHARNYVSLLSLKS
ncbi:MAG TPA: lasso peptide biosynthesis B2 protein [Candidatus Acidoferrales bacterium]|nr:lasso peptide biosynthesis B2 protein [Candidatus Acidoferrales bacterium]